MMRVMREQMNSPGVLKKEDSSFRSVFSSYYSIFQGNTLRLVYAH